MSAPATNALSPAPVNTTTPAASSSRSLASASPSSTRPRLLSALRTSGRSIVTTATRSATSTVTVGRLIAAPGAGSQLELLDLAAGGAGQLVDDLQALGPVLPGDPLLLQE